MPSLSRASATALVCAGSVLLVFGGVFVWDARESITAISLILVVLATPWAAITTVGFLRARGHYRLDDLQVFNRGGSGGVYWFTAGWNLRAVSAWVAGAAFGCLAIDCSLYTGPLAGLAGGVDISFAGSAAVAVLVYLALLRMLPEDTCSAEVQVTPGIVLAAS